MNVAERIADHEAAHATAALLLGLPVLSVSVKPDATTNGRVAIRYADTDEDMHKRMSVILSGMVESGDTPQWPLRTDRSTDEANLRQVADCLGLDESGYDKAVRQTFDLTTTRPYLRLHAAVSHALEQHQQFDEQALRTLKTIALEEAQVERKTLGAATVDTDQEFGTFAAVVSAWGPDREHDVIERQAFDRTIIAWQRSGKNLPLLFEHSTEAVGHVDPYSMHASDEGLVVAGKIDRGTPKGQQVWRQIKAGTAAFSIGFMAKSTPRDGGGKVLHEIDLLEISFTSTPMHPAARAVSWKSAGLADDSMALALNRAYALADQAHHKSAAAVELRRKAETIAREFAPITVKSFDC